MKTVYVETSIPSYLVSRESRNIIVLGHQLITKDWWSKSHQFDLYISEVVMLEILNGDKELSRKRIELIKEIPLLDFHPEIERIAAVYMDEFKFPDKVLRDAFHIAYAVFYEIDFLLSWNCKHLANANIRKKLTQINQKLGYETPDICTPEELVKSF